MLAGDVAVVLRVAFGHPELAETVGKWHADGGVHLTASSDSSVG